MLGFCLCGAGRIGSVHARNLAQNPEARLRYVVDVYADAAQGLARQYGATAVGDIATALDDSRVDAVIIATPSITHPELLVAAARAGKAIFCEKPIALETNRAVEAAQQVQATGVPTFMGFNRRFDPASSALHAGIQAGEIGQVEMVVLTNRDPRVTIGDYLKAMHQIAPFILLRESTVHDMDMARWMLGEEPNEVYAVGSSLVDAEIGKLDEIDTAMLTLKTKSGKLCHINNSWRAVYGYDQRVEVMGSEGMLRAENRPTTGLVRYTREGAMHDPLFSGPPDTNNFFLYRYAESYQNELNHFIAAVGAGVAPSPSLADGLKAQLLVQAAVDSITTHQPIQVAL